MILLAQIIAAIGLIPAAVAFLAYITADNSDAKAFAFVIFLLALAFTGAFELIAGICWLIG